MSENITKDNNSNNNKQMTTRERQQIEVAKLEAELNALKVDAFAKVRYCFFFLFSFLFRRRFRWGLRVLNDDDEISSLSICALSSRFQQQQRTAKSPNAFSSAVIPRADE